MYQFDKSLVWFRRDLRTFDHAALYHALKSSRVVYCAFVFDTEILDSLPRHDRRVEFIHASVAEVMIELQRAGSALLIAHGLAKSLIPSLAGKLGVDAVFANHDYEPQALARDKHVAATLRRQQCAFLTFKDHVIFECDEIVTIVTKAGTAFSVFTPYKNAWIRKITAEANGHHYLKSHSIEQYQEWLAVPERADDYSLPALSELGFEKTDLLEVGILPGMSGGAETVEDFLPKMPDYAYQAPHHTIREIRSRRHFHSPLRASTCPTVEQGDSCTVAIGPCCLAKGGTPTGHRLSGTRGGARRRQKGNIETLCGRQDGDMKSANLLR